MPIYNLAYWIQTAPWPTPWTPWADTLLYLKFNNNLNDDSGKGNTITWSWIGYTTLYGNVKCVELTSTTWWINWPWDLMSGIWTGDFVVSFWINPITSNNNPLMFANWYEWSPRPWVQMFMMYRNGWGLSNQVSYHMTQVWHWSSISATSLSGTWHNLVFTRISWVCYWYIDWQEKFTSWSDSTDLSRVNILKILNRADFSEQKWNSTGVKMSELIVEEKWWSGQESLDYYNQTKWNYWY